MHKEVGMKRILFISFMAVLAIVAFAGVSNAAPKFVSVQPTCDTGGNVSIPAMPSGATLVNVEVYDDVNGSKPKPLGPKSSFRLEPGQGFNFLWSDASGTYFQMITPQSKAPVGLMIDCSWIDPKTGQPACKYLYPVK
jgi:hypothetical protein